MAKLMIKDTRKLRLEIAKKGYSQREFAAEVGISQGYLSQLLRGDRALSAKVGCKIAKGLNADIEEFFLIKLIDITINGRSLRSDENVTNTN